MKDMRSEPYITPVGSATGVADRAARGQAVAELCRKTEDVFLEAGDHLVAISGALGQTQSVLALFEDVNAKGTLTELRQHGQWHDSELRALSDDVFKALGVLTTLMQRARGVDGQVRDLRDSLKMMNIVVLNARIAVAATTVGPQDNQSNLTGFTEDATRLVAELGTILGGLDEAMQRIKAESGDALEHARLLGDLLTSSLKGPVASLNGALGTFESHIMALGSASAEIADRSKSLLGASATAVAGLQIGDTTRQRLEHVQIILEHIPDAPGEAHALTALAAHQMQDIATAHVDAVGAVRDGSTALQNGILMLLRDHLMIFDHGNGSRRLKAGLQDIEDRIGQAVGIQGMLMQFARTLSQEFDALTKIIAAGELFEMHMRMIGINAVIACARLGRRGFALREIAGQLQQLARDVSDRLPVVKSELAEMTLLASEVIDLLEAACQRANALPEGAVRPLSEGVREIGDAAARSSDIVSAIRKKLDGSRGWLGPVTNHTHLIERTARLFAIDLQDDSFPEKTPGVAADMVNIYTMERERLIHRKLFHAAGGVAKIAAPSPEATQPSSGEETLDDIFF
ncbi:MAG: hypothetical protein ACEPO2_03370 [Pelagibaca sp.]